MQVPINSGFLPLFERARNAQIGWLSEGIDSLGLKPGAVTAEVFLQQVVTVAQLLPDAPHAINLCSNRYLFLLGLCATVVRGQTNLLPPNKRTATQQSLAEDYPDCYLLHDGVAELSTLFSFDINTTDLSAMASDFCVPKIAASQIAVISFTSGSTGKSKPNIKTWQTIATSTRINAHYMLPNQDETFYHLATVPGQHMWGLETSVIMALFAKVCIVDSQPFYPRDIAAQIARLPQPRTLIATPVHLRAMNSLSGSQPCLANVLCATAPLDCVLAQQIEAKFTTSLREVYGCSEVGSMAVRQTARTSVWERFEGLNFNFGADGLTQVSGDHLPGPVTLEDRLQPLGGRQFTLEGRQTDQIKVAGKRGSLQHINQVLLACDGVLDGVVFLPPQKTAVPRLAAMIVLDDACQTTAVKRHLRTHLDEAFLPRPLLQVTQLPREENGKLNQRRLLRYFATEKAQRR